MLSMNKLLILVAAVALVWFGFRWWQRQQIAKREPPRRTQHQSRGRAGDVEDMRACPTCGTYVTAGSGPCERLDCPRRAAA
jgi:hypothetical protein